MAGAAAFLPGPAKASRPADDKVALPATGAAPTRDQLTARVNATFRVQRDGLSAVSLVLVEVADPAISRLRPGNDPNRFRATFRGSAKSPLTQDTYDVAAKGMGEFPMFLVPVGRPAGDVLYYEAAFNRLAAA
jgi:hypothetical protein